MQRRSGAGCPVELALDLVGGKWKPLILYRLSGGTLRFAQLQRAMPGVTQRMLTLQLRELERDGLIRRDVHAEVPPRVEYTMLEPARGLLPILETLGDWAQAYRASQRAKPGPVPADQGDAGSPPDARQVAQ